MAALGGTGGPRFASPTALERQGFRVEHALGISAGNDDLPRPIVADRHHGIAVDFVFFKTNMFCAHMEISFY
jgi:hypothetical protein